MEQRCAGSEPLRSSRRQGDFEGLFVATLLLMTGTSGTCGERAAVSSRRPRAWEACGQARRAGAPRERAQSTGFPRPSTAREEWVGAIQTGVAVGTNHQNAMMVQGGVRG